MCSCINNYINLSERLLPGPRTELPGPVPGGARARGGPGVATPLRTEKLFLPVALPEVQLPLDHNYCHMKILPMVAILLVVLSYWCCCPTGVVVLLVLLSYWCCCPTGVVVLLVLLSYWCCCPTGVVVIAGAHLNNM